MFHIPFPILKYVFKIWCAFVTCCSYQFGLVSFQVLNSHMWLVAIILDSIVLDSFLLHHHIFVLYWINSYKCKKCMVLFI